MVESSTSGPCIVSKSLGNTAGRVFHRTVPVEYTVPVYLRVPRGAHVRVFIRLNKLFLYLREKSYA